MNVPSAGSRFGPYELIKQLGEGGMGKVFQAKDTRLDRLVAIKIPIFSKKADDNSDNVDCHIKRFYREAKLAAKIKHRNVCAIHAVDEIDGHHYLDLEFIEGDDLADYLKKMGGKLRPIEAAEIVAKVASGMHALHRKDVVHRDLKPQNIMIDDEREPVILDFGLAKGIDDTELSLSGGGFLGTLRYSSPEQLKDKQLADLPTTDIYALGAILYELISGEYADAGDNERDVIRSKWNPPQPLKTFVPDIPEMLDDICMKMLNDSPDDRQESMSLVSNELNNFLFRHRLKSTSPEYERGGLPIGLFDTGDGTQEAADPTSHIDKEDLERSRGYYDSGPLTGENEFEDHPGNEPDDDRGQTKHSEGEAIHDTESNSGALFDSAANNRSDHRLLTRPVRRLKGRVPGPFQNRRLVSQIEKQMSKHHVTVTGNIDDHFMVDLYHGSRTLNDALELYALDAGYKFIAEVDHNLNISFPVEGHDIEIRTRGWKRSRVDRLKQLLGAEKPTLIILRYPYGALPASSLKMFKKGISKILDWKPAPTLGVNHLAVFVVPMDQNRDFQSLIYELGHRVPGKIEIGLPDKDELICFLERHSAKRNLAGELELLADYAKKWKKNLRDVEDDLVKFLAENPQASELTKLYPTSAW